MFQVAKQNRVFQDVISQIEEAILSGEIKIGEKLPAERKLTEMFETSRGTIREALRVLEQKGLISIKTGTNGGAIVESVKTEKVSESLDLLIRSQSLQLNHISQFREDVEGNVTYLAAKNVVKEDIPILEKIVGRVKEAVDAGIDKWDDYIKADNDFHTELARIAGNPIYESIIKTVHENINRYYDAFLSKEDERMEENYQDMAEILKAVSKKEAGIAQELARSHVRRFNEFMKNNSSEDSSLHSE